MSTRASATNTLVFLYKNKVGIAITLIALATISIAIASYYDPFLGLKIKTILLITTATLGLVIMSTMIAYLYEKKKKNLLYQEQKKLSSQKKIEVAMQLYEERNYSKALPLFFHAATQLRNSDAMFYLGHIYHIHLLQEGTRPLAVEWYEKAAALNHKDAIFYLGVIHEDGVTPQEKNLPLAIKYYEKAAALEHADAMFSLGLIYELGRTEANGSIEVQKDLEKAIEWYGKAVVLNHSKAISHLVRCKNKVFYKNYI